MSSSKVWSRFVATRKSDGVSYKFRVQEGTADDKGAILDFMVKYMTPTETFSKAAGLAKNKDTLEEFRRSFGLLFTYNYTSSLICYEDKESNTENPIIGFSLMSLEEENKEDDISEISFKLQLQTPEMMKMLHIMDVTDGLYSARKMLGLDKYYSGRGVCVRPDYAGLGIASELIKLRRVLSQKRGVPATGAWMTAIGSQKAAERAGWKTVHEISFDELGRLCECEFVNSPPTCKFMVMFSENK